ncbi:hydrolase [Opitutaceae bacterium EW11]|nr:hydrolase [Opitutaceae bacterium EW11]
MRSFPALCSAALALAAGCVLRADTPSTAFQSPGVTSNLPVFREALAARQTYPFSWNSGSFPDFGAWKNAARQKLVDALLAPPPAVDFAPVVRAEEDRGSYVAREIVLQLTGDSRVLALMTVPKGKGPFPAVLLLHDHGARFDIGKEKTIEPLRSSDKLAAAREWAAKGYGGRFVGDELAKRGYVCLSVDALNWGDRGGGGYDGQQAISSNLLNLGSSFAGLIAWEDLRAAEFLATRPEVDPRRVGSLGWSMGGFRSCQVAALSEHISAAVSICWMGTLKGLLQPGGNLTRGGSSYTMTHPGLSRYLDYPDMVSIACPKPLLVLAGRQDKLFPVPVVEEAFRQLHAVWSSQQADDRLTTRFWDVPHSFGIEMQDEAFTWLDHQLGARR